MEKLQAAWAKVVGILNPAGDWAGLLILRLLMAYEFGKAGFTKLNGTNWFGRIQENFPFPFNVLPVEFNWFMATWVEVLGGIMLFFGLFTRFWAFSLIVVTIVAIFGFHWPAEWSSLAELWESSRVSKKDGSGNFRIPLLFLAMLIPLVLIGPGKLSVDHLINQRFGKK